MTAVQTGWGGFPAVTAGPGLTPQACVRAARRSVGTLLVDTARALNALRRDVPAAMTPGGIRGTVIEAAWVSAHLTIYPLGLFRERYQAVDRYGLEGLPPVQRGLMIGDIEAAGTPILLVHGMVDNRAIFTVLKRWLRRRGFGRVLTINYSVTTNDIRAAALDLSAEVEALVAQTGYERFHVIGHSLGGLIARYYVQRLAGDDRVHTLVTLGSPHEGTELARLVPVHLCRQLIPGSDLFAELAEPAPGCRTRFIAYWSDLDQIVFPHQNAKLTHPDLMVRNVLVRRVGHMSIPIQGGVAHEIATALSQLNVDGTTLQAGVTPIADDVASVLRRDRPARTG